MNRSSSAILLTLGGFLVLLLLLGSPVAAQTPAKEGKEVDSLIERIKSARARDEQVYGDGTKPFGTTLPKDRDVKSKEASESEAKDAEKARAQRLAEMEKMMKAPRQYVKDLRTPTAMTGAKPGAGSEDAVSGWVERIRSSRSEEAEKEKAAREKAEKEGVMREATSAEPRTPAGDASTYRRFLTPMRDVSGTVGGEALRDTTAATGAAEARAAARGAGLPDPTKDPSEYETRVRGDLGARGGLPAYADKSLLGVYESNRFSRWLSQGSDVRFDSGRADASQTYQTYRSLQSMPDTGSIVGRRDVYVPNSTDFVNPTYRGSIYETPYSTDPFRRNFSQETTQSKYSSAGYYNLGTRESLEDYYTREFGVSRTFVPPSLSSRLYEVNTVKQWTQDLRRDYGVDVRPGQTTYSNLYRIRTGERRR